MRKFVFLFAKGDGTKLKPFIVFSYAKRESKALNEEFKHKCLVHSSSNCWMNEEFRIQWVQIVVGKFYLKIVEWVIESWNSLPKEMVADSLKSCASSCPLMVPKII